MNKNLSLVLTLIVVVSALVAGCGAPKVKPISPSDVEWEKILFDAKDDLRSLEVPKGLSKHKQGGAMGTMFLYAGICNMKKVACSVMVQPLDPTTLKNFTPDKILEENIKTQETAGKAQGLTFSKKYPLKDLDGNPGLSVDLVKSPNVWATVRIYVIKNKIFTYSFGGDKADAEYFTELANRFFESIKIKS